MRKILKRYIPDAETLRRNRWLAMLGDTILHPSLWHLNRRSAAGAVAMGLFTGLVPGPFQAFFALLGCLVFRVNLPLAVVTTLYTNPVTIVPLYLSAFWIGSTLLGSTDIFVAPPELGQMTLWQWMQTLLNWLAGLGAPLALGLLVQASLFAAAGYFMVWTAWRWYLVREYRRRKQARQDRAKTNDSLM